MMRIIDPETYRLVDVVILDGEYANGNLALYLCEYHSEDGQIEMLYPLTYDVGENKLDDDIVYLDINNCGKAVKIFFEKYDIGEKTGDIFVEDEVPYPGYKVNWKTIREFQFKDPEESDGENE